MPARVNFIWPFGLEKGDCRQYFLIGKLVAKRWHHAAQLDSAFLDRSGQLFQRVMPGMGAAVERRRRIVSIGVGFLPLACAFGVTAMAECAVFLEYAIADLAIRVIPRKPAYSSPFSAQCLGR